ncbi:PREDICTED: uncharacterized protein LOC108361786 [Rhagoletis zephyria]|uniref:uncharacterized protein LOC108361786 n=1 Tax=Rhagoletis zephyria TaxID=28612 RepID=UPI0008118E91|nr:PREDICTED: uncharacterized protein LOC108361786 [Rhagoletis zephyria]XP_036343106.1 uncharacterized protein LOC118752340 [Rhagoletis pomonella]XP_036343117.1 uncharacterized protein LOC118752348 [Rhagoletis pomonella]
MKLVLTPEVDMLTVSKSSINQRKLILNFAPRIGLTMVNYTKLENIDFFYLECQNFRDYNRDPYDKLSKPEVFKKHYGKCERKQIDRNSILLSLPVTSVQEKQPVVYPIKYGGDLHLEEKIRLGGQYDPKSCIKYKR